MEAKEDNTREGGVNFVFEGNFTDEQRQLFIDTQARDLEKICSYLKTSGVPIITYHVFDTLQGKRDNDPDHSVSRASARFGEMAVYRFWETREDPSFPHEMTHLVAHTWAKPYVWELEVDTWDGKKIKTAAEMLSTCFMQEGLAIAVDDIVFDKPLREDGEIKKIDDWCREQIDKIPKVRDCINADNFFVLENKLVVPFTASFSKYLLQNFGVEKYKEMYVKLNETKTPEENIKVIEEIYGKSVEELQDSWKKSITSS